ncbi:hypothetical protein [Streptomyces sp. NPDC050560]|uniref:hypothetical protein n=1 Tax=Streptomyces sp. NPDC050560 TaxID=3365630 RepID=UPI0037B0EEBF
MAADRLRDPARGEVLTGPEGARRIAAAHEAAYGDVWSPDVQWARAVAAVAEPEPRCPRCQGTFETCTCTGAAPRDPVGLNPTGRPRRSSARRRRRATRGGEPA